MANRYWIGNAGAWSNPAHWSATSGGTGGASVPTSIDNVYFDSKSFTATGQFVTVDVLANCNDMDWTGALNNPFFLNPNANNQSIYGSLTLIYNMGLSDYTSGNFKFYGSGLGKTITTGGQPIYSMFFSNADGEWIFKDYVTVSSNIILYSGMLNTNSQTVECYGNFDITGTLERTLILGSSIIKLMGGGSLNIDPGNFLNFDAGKSTIIIEDKDFLCDKIKFYNVEFQNQASTVLINGSNTFNTLTITPGATIKLLSGTTQVISYLNAIGSSSTKITIQSSNSGVPATIFCPNNSLNVRYCNIKDIIAAGYNSFEGDITFNAIKCTNNGGNTGWNFVDSTKIGEFMPATEYTTGLMSSMDKAKVDLAISTVDDTIMQGPLIAESNNNFNIAQMRNIILSTSDPILGTMGNGDIWIKYI